MELKFRPVIRAPVPTWAEGEERNLSWVFLMGTMSGHTQETLPESLKRFAIPLQSLNTVGESESGASDSVSIRTTPPWKLKKGKKQCWIIGIPVGMPAAESPTESWCDHTDYSLDPEEMEKLTTTSDKMIVEFSAMSQDIHLFDKFVWDRRTSKDKLVIISILFREFLFAHCMVSSEAVSVPQQECNQQGVRESDFSKVFQGTFYACIPYTYKIENH